MHYFSWYILFYNPFGKQFVNTFLNALAWSLSLLSPFLGNIVLEDLTIEKKKGKGRERNGREDGLDYKK